MKKQTIWQPVRKEFLIRNIKIILPIILILIIVSSVFSGLGGSGGTPPTLIAQYKMNEDTAGDNAELVENGDFADWVADDPTSDPPGWVVSGESENDPEISEVGHLEGHGGVGTGMCNIYTSDVTNVYISQNVTVVVGRRYRISINFDTITAGKIKVFDAINAQWTQFNSDATGVAATTFVATHTTITLRIGRLAACDVTFDNVSVKLCAVEDSSGNDHDGLAQQDTDDIHVAGKVGGAFDFDGTADYIEVGDHDDFSPVGTPFSISAWVYMHDATDFCIASKGVEGTDGEWRLYTDGSDKLFAHLYDENIDKYIGRTYNASALTENQWLHIVMTDDGTALSGGINLYLDGSNVDDADDEAAGFLGVENLTHDIWIGNYNGTFSDGLIDNVTFFSIELDQSDVNYLYNRGYGREDWPPIGAGRKQKTAGGKTTKTGGK